MLPFAAPWQGLPGCAESGERSVFLCVLEKVTEGVEWALGEPVASASRCGGQSWLRRTRSCFPGAVERPRTSCLEAPTAASARSRSRAGTVGGEACLEMPQETAQAPATLGFPTPLGEGVHRGLHLLAGLQERVGRAAPRAPPQRP